MIGRWCGLGLIGLTAVAVAVTVMATAGCASDREPPATEETTAADTDDPESRWPLPRTCIAPEGLGRPATIEQVVELVNALPKPLTLSCLLESLERPLSLYASTSIAGAQPATGPDNPRIFLFEGELMMSVVSEGEAKETLEMSYAIGDRKSIKAELRFPIADVIEASAPYDQVDVGGGSVCGICHDSESRVESIEFANAYASEMFQDEPDQALSLLFLRQNALDCDPSETPTRCQMLDAIFGHGEVEPGDLPRNLIICRPPG